mmetsp:Transcript_35642/g.53121  ORF Transcript_35642/g.53121 Transcript_35642/m.53121 type:complete len:145 (-) Transcript_35642:63-497(-)
MDFTPGWCPLPFGTHHDDDHGDVAEVEAAMEAHGNNWLPNAADGEAEDVQGASLEHKLLVKFKSSISIAPGNKDWCNSVIEHSHGGLTLIEMKKREAGSNSSARKAKSLQQRWFSLDKPEETSNILPFFYCKVFCDSNWFLSCA